MRNPRRVLSKARIVELYSSYLRRKIDAVGSQNSAGYQLATGKPVMAIGGFHGSAPSPTARFAASSEAPGAGPVAGGAAPPSPEWVRKHFIEAEAGGSTLYDLTDPEQRGTTGQRNNGTTEQRKEEHRIRCSSLLLCRAQPNGSDSPCTAWMSKSTLSVVPIAATPTDTIWL